MTDNITIGKQMIQHQDWYYMMVDYGYTAAKEAARASMRAFVNFMNTCSVEEAATLKDMWMDAYNNARACINGR